MTDISAAPRTPPLTLPRTGAAIAVILVVADIVGTIRYWEDPLPAVIAAFIIGLGALTLLGAYPAWQGRTWGIWLTASTRFLAIIPALPVLMEPGAPPGAVPVVAVQIPLTLLSVVLLLLGLRRRP